MVHRLTSRPVPHNADPVLLLTRPAPAAERFMAELGDVAGIEVIRSPVIRIAQLDVALPDIHPAALILTSENGVQAAARLGLAPLPAFVVGPRTEAVARASGFDPAPPVPDAKALYAHLLALRPAGPLLHVRGEHASGRVGPRLTEAGVPVVELIAYAQHALPPSDAARAVLAGARPVVLPLFSPRSAALVAGWGRPVAPLHVAAISDAAAAKAAPLAPRSVAVAATPDGPGMVAATRRAIRRAREG
ncbi:MAG: uroporphyrinogen-III synthase [Rubellimicrobium sp.]|nr:uroporphyrinogen-III synthase [Rubellimicrobium sp.]